MEGMIFSEDLCRLCLWRSNKLLPIFSEEAEMQNISLKIGICLPISVTREDILPKLICSQCVYKLEMFSEFRNSCVRSEQLLKRYTSYEPVPVQPCHTVVMQVQDEMKIEIQEPDPIAVDQEMPFMCLIPEGHKEQITEPPTPVVVETMSAQDLNLPTNDLSFPASEIDVRTELTTETESQKNVDSTLSTDTKKQKVEKKKPALKKSSKSNEPLAVKRVHSDLVPAKDKGTRRMTHLPALTASRRMHRCKHCSKNFPSRVLLSRHLTSSNCLLRVTCRYCAKIFSTAENRVQHERNHRDKKNFMCRICKNKFQSSFDLNVHTVEGCERQSMSVQSGAAAEARKGQVKEEKSNKSEKINDKVQGECSPIKNTVANVKSHIKCKFCNKKFTHSLPFRKHLHHCRRSTIMTKLKDIRKRNVQIRQNKKIFSMEVSRDPVIREQIKRKFHPVYPEGIRMRPLSRRNQNHLSNQSAVLENSFTKNSEISPKASLLAVLGLKEKTKPQDSKGEDVKNSKTNNGEVVTVCDICRKIFTSESGMLNHQSTVHNRNLTAEKIKTLMRVEV